MKLKTFLTTAVLVLTSTLFAQKTTWKIDRSHSTIGFTATHFKIASINGIFEDFSGNAVTEGDDFSTVTFDVLIKTNSIDTNQKIRDKDLRGSDFFNADKYPEITFKSTEIVKKTEKEYEVKGILSVNGISKEFVFSGTFQGIFVHPRFKKTIAVYNLKGSFPRFDYNIGTKYPDAALGKNIEISVNVEMIKQENKG